MFEWEKVIEYFPQIIQKLPVTLQIVFGAFLIGLVLGCVFAFVRIRKVVVFNQLIIVFISYIRCTPIICQMFVVYFGTPVILQAVGVDITAVNNMTYVLLAYGLNMAGFMGETIRAAILAVPVGQTEAGRAAGLTEPQTMLHIIAPQAMRIALPTFGTIFVALFQATALAYLVGVIDMIGRAVSIGARTGRVLEGYVCCAIVFAVISIVLEHVFNYINRKLDFGRSGHPVVRKRREKKLEVQSKEEVSVL